ncbi:Translation initiation factor eIF-2B subunit beta [Histomonas meleagridis]|uniref:Translation initiation factor eIF-2B subunit beta n=1 Tax=Histomonas meleagridis TaxID=135588 RepID=UPI003559D061|nr:Translation initiation factor eIF-2B subunit beta [Histomonas meleagridis]
MAEETLRILKECVEESKTSNQIEQNLNTVAKRLQNSISFDIIVGNFCRKVISSLNEILNKSVPFYNFDQIFDVRRSNSLSLLEFFAAPVENKKNSFTSTENSLKVDLLDSIDRMLDEIPLLSKCIAKYSMSIIHDGDIIMTVGTSASVEAFFERAVVKGRKFHVILPEHAPSYDGITMAKRLRNKNINCITIPDSAVFALMPRITTVICPVRAVFADGTLLTTNLVKAVALAAKYYSKPFVVLYWKCKLADRFKKPKESFTYLASPNDVVPQDDTISQTVGIINPDGECFSSHSLVTMLVSEDGPHDPHETFSLVQNFYSQNE